ncbi:MAG: protein kinase [Candidatus Dormibacteraceae bacterium]
MEHDEGPFPPGSRVDQFDVEELVGEGPFGPVYRAHDTRMSRAVELRVVAATDDDPEAVDRLDRSLPRLIALRHPNLQELYAGGARYGAYYLVAADLRGSLLADRLESDRPRVDTALAMLEDLGQALDYVHTQGRVHGAVEAAAVEIRPDGRAILSDLGVATALAPDPGTMGRQEDLQGFGALAFQILTGQLYVGGRQGQPASTLNRELGQATDDALERAIHGDPQGRMLSAGQIVGELAIGVRQDRLGGARPPAGRPIPVAQPSLPAKASGAGEAGSGSNARRNWIIAGVVALIVVLAVVGIVIWRLNSGTSPAMQLSTTTPSPGSQVTVTLTDLPKSQVGSLQLDNASTQLATFQANGQGSATVNVTIPKSTSGGNHQISACWAGTCPVSQTITVPKPSPTPSPSATPTPTPVPITPAPPTPTPVRPPPTQPPTPTPTPTATPTGPG